MSTRIAPTCHHTRRSLVMLAAAAPLLQAGTLLPGQDSAQAGPDIAAPISAAPDFAAIEARTGGRIGVAALDLGTGQTVSHRGDERFAMCSTFKWLLAGLVLQRVERGEEDLERRIEYTAEDLVFHSPVTQNHTGPGGMTIGELCSATIRTSDNTAANLLIASLGGPDGFTERVRAAGDTVTRLDRLEPALNQNAPGDPRDTSSPLAMLGLMRLFLFGDALNDTNRRRLQDWMIAANTGLDRLRAGLPEGWIAGDKTGTSNNNANNDVAFAIPPQDAPAGPGPLLLVSFIDAPDPATPETNAIHRSVAEEAVRTFLGR